MWVIGYRMVIMEEGERGRFRFEISYVAPFDVLEQGFFQAFLSVVVLLVFEKCRLDCVE